MAIEISVQIENEVAFRNALERAKNAVSDLRIPLTLIAKDFFKSQKAIFQLKSAGQYEDLNKNYKKFKTKKLGSPYPILRFSGRLERSVTEPDSSESINRIINNDTLEVGTKVPYAGFLQFGTKRMKPRPFLFIGPEASRYATSEQMGRTERWLNTLNDFVLAKIDFAEQQ